MRSNSFVASNVSFPRAAERAVDRIRRCAAVRPLLVVLLTALPVLGNVSRAQGGPTTFARQRLPLWISIEHNGLKSSLYLSFEIKPYGEQLDAMAQMASTDSVKLFTRLMLGLRDRDDAAVGELL